MSDSIPYIGEIFALLTAITWAWGVVLFKKSGETVHPIALNIFKNVLAMVLILPTMHLFGETLLPPVPLRDFLLILASGAIGIGITDTFFFKSLNLLGASLSAIIDCLYSPFVIGLSVLWLGESLTVLQVLGVIIILSAVLTATSRKGSDMIPRRNLLLGIFYGVSSLAMLAVSLMLVKPLLDRLPLLWLSEVRLIGGMIVLGMVIALHPKRRCIMATLAPREGWKYSLAGSFVGAYLTFIFWLAGMKFAQVSVVAALNQTSNIFIFIFAAIFLRESINRRRAAAILMGVAGSMLVTFS